MQPRGPGDILRFLGGSRSHNEIAIGYESEWKDWPSRPDLQVFVTWTRADLMKTKVVSLDLQDQAYFKFAMSGSQWALGNQTVVVANVNLNDFFNSWLRTKWKALPTLWAAAGGQLEVGPGGHSAFLVQGGFKVTITLGE